MLTEANVEAHSFRLEFAQEVLHAFRAKRQAGQARDRESCAAAPPAVLEPTRPNTDPRPGSAQTPSRRKG